MRRRWFGFRINWSLVVWIRVCLWAVLLEVCGDSLCEVHAGGGAAVGLR